MTKEYLTFGYIHHNCNLETIYCGDHSMEGVSELNFEICEGRMQGIYNEFNCEVGNADLYDAQSGASDALSNFLSVHFGFTISSIDIAGAYGLANDEPTEDSDIFNLLECQGGEFHNPDGKYNNKYYMRHYWDEDGEIYGECVCICMRPAA